MTLRARLSSPRIVRMFVWAVLLLLLTGASSVSEAKKPENPPRFGFWFIPLSPDLAEDLGLPRTLKGLVLASIGQGTPAESAGLKPGDVIVKMQKQKAKPVETPDMTRYEAATKGLRANQDWTLYVVKSGSGQETPITLQPSTAEFGLAPQLPANSAPATIKVAADGSGNVRTLSGALFKARPGDTVAVAGKQASASVMVSNITITSQDAANPAEVAGLEILGVKGVTVKGLSVIASTGSQAVPAWVGVRIESSSAVTVEGCKIQGFSGGIRVAQSEGVVIGDNIITQNFGGIYAISSAVTISRNLVFRNAMEDKARMDFCGGIDVVGGSAEITHNTVLENQVSPERFRALLTQFGAAGVGISIADANAVVANNLVLNNNIGVMVSANAQATVEYNDILNHVIQGGVWSKGSNEYHLQAAPANFLTQISYEYKPQPIFPIINFDPNRHFYTPALQFQPSQTNLMVDPLFADRLKGDYRLAPDSPLINKGRGGTYIGAFGPVGPPPTAQAAPSASTASVAQAPPAGPAPAAPFTPSGPRAGQPSSAQSGEYHALVQGNTLYVQAEAIDALLTRVRQRLAENPQNLDRVVKGGIGVVPFGLIGAAGLTLSPGLGEDFTTAMINSGFRPADSGLLTKALAELQVKEVGQLEQGILQEIGQRAKCAFLLVGSVSDRGPTVVLNVRIVEAKTGDYLAAERIELTKIEK